MNKDLSRLYLEMVVSDVPLSDELIEEPDDCHTYFNFIIYENRYESRKHIGSLGILKIDYEEFGLFESLDCHSDAVALLDLFQNIKNATLKTKYRKNLNTLTGHLQFI
ncbi:hypothetical protein CIG1485E_a0086 (plasmid) [Campylobacter iguaniorum]|uniref:Uncharacterized protein n=1 Tax=Campylobacter iguaniorum TaxID=1244531 RepID=A0A076FCF3_9BACT|nr:hypothetical protein [Campylobacter iguaniorum]AII15611.1 hypothetical protein CIG1485E_a0086 [Campylobacter iguaniorum]